MKIVSVFVFALAMIGTWRVAYSARSVSESVHVGIQEDLKRIITEYIEKKLPEAKNIRFEKFWTETVKKDQVRAFFAYSFDDSNATSGSTRTAIEGYATLNKADETEEEITWNFDELQVKDNRIEFVEPIKIRAGSDELDSEKTDKAE